MATLISSPVENGTRASTSWVAGLRKFSKCEVWESTNLPLISIFTFGTEVILLSLHFFVSIWKWPFFR
jgi:hypothetical protein